MALSWLYTRRLESTQDGSDGGGGGETPAQINARGNRDRLAKINSVGRTADGKRARELVDVDGERVVGRFQDGELDDSPEARERAELERQDLAEEALREQAERAAAADELEEEEARRRQSEGGDDGDDDGGDTRQERGNNRGEEEPDERVIDGVRYYRTMVSGQEKWLTLKQLREGVSNGLTTEETLRRAQEALDSATRTPPTPKADEVQLPDEAELENIIISAATGDEEAVRKLAQVVRSRPAGPSRDDIGRQVAQQIATQRLLDQAEAAQADLLGDQRLEPVFRMRLSQFAQAQPKTRIDDAYKAVGDAMRKDFAPLLKPDQRRPASKLERKRTIVNPPRSAGRQPTREDDDREVPVGEQIDAIARSRGQQRAHRIRRS